MKPGIAVSYDASDDRYDLNTFENHLTNYEGNYNRQLGAVLQSGHCLNELGHFFSVRWKVGNYSGAKSTQAFEVAFTYEMTNMIDYTDWVNGEHTFSDIVFYDTL